MGRGFFGRPIVETGAASSTSRRSSSARADSISTTGTFALPAAGVLGLDRRPVALLVEQPRRLRDPVSIVLHLPKIQTAGEAALWNDLISALERLPASRPATIKTYVLVEQIEACFQLMEIRAALGRASSAPTRAAGVTSTASPTRWPGMAAYSVNPNIDAIAITYGYMGDFTRIASAAQSIRAGPGGRYALWRGGDGTEHSDRPRSRRRRRHETRGRRRRARTARGRQRRVGRPLEDGPRRPAHCWEAARRGEPAWTRSSRRSPTPTPHAAALSRLEPAPRTERGAHNLLSVALGSTATQLWPGGVPGRSARNQRIFFGNDDVLLSHGENMATGEIRLSILWEWLHKGAAPRRRRAVHA